MLDEGLFAKDFLWAPGYELQDILEPLAAVTIVSYNAVLPPVQFLGQLFFTSASVLWSYARVIVYFNGEISELFKTQP